MEAVRMSEKYYTGCMLAVVGGFLDAHTYISRGGVFANAQTGNMVLLGLSLAEGHFLQAAYYLIPIGAFVLGVLVAEGVRARLREKAFLHWRQQVVLLEMLVLCVVAFLPAGRFDPLANCLVSFACSLQVETFRKVHGKAYASTMCTGNLRSGTEQLCLYLAGKNPRGLLDALQYYGIILIFILGAILGTVVTDLWGEQAVLCGVLLLFIVWMLLFAEQEKPEKQGRGGQ